MAKHKSLGDSKLSKNDEFYTQFNDIQSEMNAYLEQNPDVFRGKTVLLPCDDPEWSNFTRYFAQNFTHLGLKKLISTSYAPNSKPEGFQFQPTLFEMESPQFDSFKNSSHGKIFTLCDDKNGDQLVNFEDLQWSYLEGDGDFQSAEIRALRNEADIIITNPPFSLFKEFLGWIFEEEKEFVIVANMNAVTYKEVFRLIMEGKLWLGATRSGVGSMWFQVPDDAPEKQGQKIDNGKRYQTIGNSAWFCNVDHGRRHEKLTLMTEEENIRFGGRDVLGKGYVHYDNYDAIEVPRVEAIPSDYKGVMGVPITFLSKYNPEQFEIIGASDNGAVPEEMKLPHHKRHNEPFIDGVKKFKRIFIRHLGEHEN
jgi:hypothetical protein